MYHLKRLQIGRGIQRFFWQTSPSLCLEDDPPWFTGKQPHNEGGWHSSFVLEIATSMIRNKSTLNIAFQCKSASKRRSCVSLISASPWFPPLASLLIWDTWRGVASCLRSWTTILPKEINTQQRDHSLTRVCGVGWCFMN